MKTERLAYWEECGAVVNEEHSRFEIALENGGKIVGYYPVEGVQIFAFDIRDNLTSQLLDVRKRCSPPGPFLRTNACRTGSFELKRGERSAMLWDNEIAVDYGTDFQPLEYMSGNAHGLEMIVYLDKINATESIFGLLTEFSNRVGLQTLMHNEGVMYCFKMSSVTKRELDNLIRDCLADADASIVLIRAALVCYQYNHDRLTSKSMLRNLVSKSQMMIAEDIYSSLTDRYDQKWTASHFARKYGYSTTTVKKYFEDVYGYEFKAYQISVRMERAADMLRTSTLSVGEIAQRVGYSTHAKFGAMFKETYGITPLAYRRSQKITNAK